MYWRAVGTDAVACGMALGAVVVISTERTGRAVLEKTAICPISPGGMSLFLVWGFLLWFGW
jgi:hypothetical protein